ncbi:hypothetical protein FFL34_01525 [Lentibacillus cibarius]|uniref:Excalibur calcium-binding domain-containing protein n=2 Tax=Lentibacillus cibarius TaxID=2583219 RepID=A0A5S3QQ16_9BACI|nr:hypothetical protein FFL34_01525 [Lentibacillus cibarius]
MVVFFGYWCYRHFKVREVASFDGDDVLTIILGSFMAQWSGVAILIISSLFGGGIEPVDGTDEGVPVFYENCDEARKFGGAPVHEDDPGYHPGLDRDGDGVGCESW